MPNPQKKPNKVLTGEDRKAIIKRFHAVNRERLRQVEEVLTPRQKVFIEILPFLFHTNHPVMPGFVSKDTPSGLAVYSPSNKTLAVAARLAKSFDYKKRLPQQYDIEAVFLIGSAGTVAYTRNSDFDVWLCHRTGLGSVALANLRNKADKISEWTGTLGLEVHFFLMTAEDVRLGRHAALSSESSGSAQRHLLLDEFYRTALFIGGRYPLWWLVPPEKETVYQTYTAGLLEKRFVRDSQIIDFGELSHIPSNEFFGASLWQLYKAIGSPFKSVLKILLLEAYASEYPDTVLLSHIHKRAIYEGRTRPDQLDPYLLMMTKVEDYLKQGQDAERLELARHSFYFKASQNMGDAKTPPGSNRIQDWLHNLTQNWGWDANYLARLANPERWKLEQVLEERALLISTLMRSYKFLSGFAREQRELFAISQEDMTMLGRRLFAAFELKSGKLELINQGIAKDLSEPQLYLQRSHNNETENWLLFRGLSPRRNTTPLKRSHTLVELVAWCHFNGIITTGSHITLDSSEHELSQRDVSAILGALQRQFPRKRISSPAIEELSRPSLPVSASVLVNVGIDPFVEYTRQGKHLTSSRIDPLNYGSRQQNLALTFDYIYTTNWGEVFLFHYEGMDGLTACLENYLRSVPGKGISIPLTTHCFSTDRGHSIARRIRQLIEDISRYFFLNDSPSPRRYILKAGDQYHALHLADGVLNHASINGYSDLLDYLGNPCEMYTPVAFDSQILTDSPLPSVFQRHKQGTIRFYYLVAAGYATVYVLDENGSLFQETNPFHDEDTLFNQYQRFFDAVRYRENAANVDDDKSFRPPTASYYRLVKQRTGTFLPQPVLPPQATESLNYSELKVISERAGDTTQFTLYYDGREFSMLEHGNRLFAKVAHYILQQRSSGDTYPIYITDIDLSGIEAAPGAASGHLQTVHYLRYKRLIELRLNEALGRQSTA